MIGPGGFMQAPNTHESREDAKRPVERLVGERTCDVLSAPRVGTGGAGPVDIYWELQAGRPAHKFTRAIKCY